MLCVTNRNEILELQTHPYSWCMSYNYKTCPITEIEIKHFYKFINVADIDNEGNRGEMSLDDIKLVARIKR